MVLKKMKELGYLKTELFKINNLQGEPNERTI
jgi:hypothetical protein